MTTAHLGPASAARDVGQAEELLRERGLRISAARRLVLEALFAAAGPVSAEQIAAGPGGRAPASDLASVYRNLETLERLGIVRHFHAGHGPGLYALVDRIAPGYLVCERCGATCALDEEDLAPLRDAIASRRGYEVTFGHFPLVGLCPECLEDRDE